jgi:serine/threonine protein kinase
MLIQQQLTHISSNSSNKRYIIKFEQENIFMNQLIGKTLGPYRLTDHLGSGGFAEVYQGKHVQTGWEVAIKVLNINYSEDSFRKEADLLWKLNHQHIVKIYSYDIESGTAYLVMERAANGSLRDLHPLGQVLPQPLILDYVKHIASALDYMHQNRLVHCDIKPPNFLVRANNEVILGDFGIATEAVSQSLRNSLSPNSSQPGIVGTIHYIAPEQWLGHPPTHATDQYALAVVVYEWLCGNRPFSGTKPVVIAQAHIANPPPPFNDASISSDLEDVVMRALSKDPRDRYPSIMEFVQALENAIQNRPIFPKQSQQGHSNNHGASIWGKLNLQGQQPIPNPPHQGASIWGKLNLQGQQPTGRGPHEDPDPTIAVDNWQLQQGGQQNTGSIFAGQNVKKRKIHHLDWGNLRETPGQTFLWLGGIADLLCGILWFFLSHNDFNIAVIIFLLTLALRVLCVAAIRPSLACPFAWVLSLFETFTFSAFLIYINSNLYVLVILVFAITWYLNEFLYARKK